MSDSQPWARPSRLRLADLREAPFRCVWLTEKQALDHGLAGSWDAAPEDAWRAVRLAIEEGYISDAAEADAVLKALGHPEAPA